MSRGLSILLIASAALTFAAGPPWEKPSRDWTPEDARQILADSPWSKPVEALILPLQSEDQRREGGNMGQPHGIGFDGFADDRPRVQIPGKILDIVKPEKPVNPKRPNFTVQLRWENALPIRVAELKAGVVEPPTLTREGYRLAVYGIPGGAFKGTPEKLGEPLKSLAFLKREGKKDVRPSSVEVFQRESGLIIVYLFPISAEITRTDGRIEFDAQIGRVSIAHSFPVSAMFFQNQLEL